MNCRQNRYIVVYPPPPPTPTQLVGGLGVKIGGTDGREGLMGGREGCDGNYEVDPVHMAWNGCIILIRNPSEAGNQLVINRCKMALSSPSDF